MNSTIKNVRIVNTADIHIQLETKEEIAAFKEILVFADRVLRDKYVGGGVSLTKKMIEELEAQLKKEGL